VRLRHPVGQEQALLDACLVSLKVSVLLLHIYGYTYWGYVLLLHVWGLLVTHVGFIYLYMYICMFTGMYIPVHIYTHIHMCISIYSYAYVYLNIDIHAYLVFISICSKKNVSVEIWFVYKDMSCILFENTLTYNIYQNTLIKQSFVLQRIIVALFFY